MTRKILLADDSVAIHKVVKLTFLGEDMDVVAVSNGAEALRQAAELKPDLIVVDIIMPGLTGYEVCAQLRQHPATAATPVILLVGAFESFDPVKAQEVGATSHLMKPLEPQSLLRLVRSLLGEKGTTTAVDDYTENNSLGASRSFELISPSGKLPPLDLIDAAEEDAAPEASSVRPSPFPRRVDQASANSLDDILELPHHESPRPDWHSFEPLSELKSTPDPLEDYFAPVKVESTQRDSEASAEPEARPAPEEADESAETTATASLEVFNVPESPTVQFFGEAPPTPALFVSGEEHSEEDAEPEAAAAEADLPIDPAPEQVEQFSVAPTEETMNFSTEPAPAATPDSVEASATATSEADLPAAETAADSLVANEVGEAVAAAADSVNHNSELLVSPELVEIISERVVARLRETLREEVREAIEEALNDYLRHL